MLRAGKGATLPHRLESIASKLGRAIALCAGGSMLMSTLAVVALLYRYGQVEAIECARANAGYIASELAERLNRGAQITRELESLTKAASQTRRPSREQVTGRLKEILQREPLVQGVWLIAEPNGFDGRDVDYRGAFAASARGEFYPYWYRRSDGRLVQDTTGRRDNVAADRASAFYRTPVEQNRIVVTEPFAWRMGEGAGEWKSMSSIAAPVRLGDRLIGVVGADLYLGLTLTDGASSIAYYAVSGFESVGGRRLAELLHTHVAPLLPTLEAHPRGMRLPVLRETRMPAVLCAFGPAETVSELSPRLASAMAWAVGAWVATPTA